MSDKRADAIETMLTQLRAGFEAYPLAGGGHVVATPMIHGDGDGLAVIVHRDRDGWYITDQGSTASHLFFDNMDDTDDDGELARKLRVMVEWHGATFDENFEIRVRVPDPVAEDTRDLGNRIADEVGDFMQIIAQVQGVAVVHWADKKAVPL